LDLEEGVQVPNWLGTLRKHVLESRASMKRIPMDAISVRQGAITLGSFSDIVSCSSSLAGDECKKRAKSPCGRGNRTPIPIPYIDDYTETH